MNNPTYQELEQKIKKLEIEKMLIHKALSKYLKDLNHSVLGLLIGANAPFKLEKYFGHPSQTIDLENPNLEYYKKDYFTVIGVVDSE